LAGGVVGKSMAARIGTSPASTPFDQAWGLLKSETDLNRTFKIHPSVMGIASKRGNPRVVTERMPQEDVVSEDIHRKYPNWDHMRGGEPMLYTSSVHDVPSKYNFSSTADLVDMTDEMVPENLMSTINALMRYDKQHKKLIPDADIHPEWGTFEPRKLAMKLLGSYLGHYGNRHPGVAGSDRTPVPQAIATSGTRVFGQANPYDLTHYPSQARDTQGMDEIPYNRFFSLSNYSPHPLPSSLEDVRFLSDGSIIPWKRNKEVQ
jgi:hypothetical protein